MTIIMNLFLIHSIALLVIVLYPNKASSFVLQPSPPTGTSAATTASYTALFLAKATKKQKKKKATAGAASGGGFGKAAATADNVKKPNDYAVFPALEPPVRQTLVPTPPSMIEEIESTGSLPIEIYDRLDQIYGFPDFNHETVSIEEGDEDSNGDDGGSFSFEDLLAAPTSSSISNTAGTSTTSTNNAMDINELLAAATGGPVETLPTKGGSDQGDSSGDENAVAAASEMRTAISSLLPFEKFRVLHVDPLVLAVDDFFTEEECDRYVEMSLAPVDDDGNQKTMQTRSKTVGKDAGAKSQRTSTTWFHHYNNVPELMAKASRLLGLDTINRWEEPQTVRYQRNEKFTWHMDALAPTQATDDLGGQRLATLLVYLKDPDAGGATMFRDLTSTTGGTDDDEGDSLKVQPKKGSALLFFPAAGGIPNTPLDIRTLHCGEVVAETSETDKWISQLWLRAGSYSPTAPPGNLHEHALSDVKKYCQDASSS